MQKMADDKTIDSSSEKEKNFPVEEQLPDNCKQHDIIFPSNTDTEYYTKPFSENDVNDESDICPNFSIYSATSTDFTKYDYSEVLEKGDAAEPSEECDENLVQMTDDEDECLKKFNDDELERNVSNAQNVPEREPIINNHDEEINNSNEEINNHNKSLNDQCEKHILNENAEKNKGDKKNNKNSIINKTIPLIPNRKVFLELYDDSDWEEWTNEKTDDDKLDNDLKKSDDIEKFTESISDADDDRGYTPCQDEPSKTANSSGSGDNRKSNSSLGICGLDTEMVSEEEGNTFTDDLLKLNLTRNLHNLLEDGEIFEKNKNLHAADDSNNIQSVDKSKHSKGNEKSSEKKSNTEVFKKVSAKDRNYREKDKKKKSRSKSKEKRNHRKKKEYTSRKKEKRKELEWYDVRNMISEKNKFRSDKDEYGRERRPARSRSNSRSRTSPEYKDKSQRINRSRGRSGYRRFHNSRSKSRSVSRSRSTSGEKRRRKKKSRSSRRRSRSIGKSYVRSVHRTKSRSPPKSTSKSKRKRSASFHRDWTPSWSSHDSPVSKSPHNNNKAASPSWTPPLRDDMSDAKNLKVIVSNKEAIRRKKDKKKKDRQKENASEKVSKKRRRESLIEQPSKEVFASGDNILVSVSFNKNKSNEVINNVTQSQEHNFQKRKSKTRDNESKKLKSTKQREKSDRGSKKRRLDLANRKPIAIIDLDKSPFKELTPSPRAIIVLTDSDSEEKEQNLLTRQERLHEELESIREESQNGSPAYNSSSAFANNTGPKTPPEPQASFSLQLKPLHKLRNINILYDCEEDEDVNEVSNNEQNHNNEPDSHADDGVHIGPNTPPEPPNSPPSSPDAYDPFEPTKSPSQSPDIMNTQNNQCSVSEKQTITEDKNVENQKDSTQLSVPKIAIDDKPIDSTNTVEKVLAMLTQRFTAGTEKGLCSITQSDLGKTSLDVEAIQNSVADSKLTSPENVKTGVTILSNVLLQQNMLNILKTNNTSDSVLVYSNANPASTTPLLNLNASRSIFNASGNTVQNSTVSNKNNKSQVRPSPIKSNPIKPMVKTAVIKPGIRPYAANKVHKPVKYDGENDLDSPYSPCSDDFDDLFEPPAADPIKTSKPHKTKSPVKKNQDFDHLFSSPSYKPSITKTDKKLCSKKYKKPKSNKTQVGVKIDDDQLKILDDLPSSAVEMQVKDKFMKKLNRQERVVEEVKVVLKPHYAKKHITKEQYKDILRRAVPKICHNRSGEINPQRIHRLIEAYVKKARYSKKTVSSDK